MTRLHGLLEFAAGSAVGLLVGLIAGLSISPVTSTILGALSTGLLVLLGFREAKDSSHSGSHALRVFGFGLFCSIALILGIGLRTHQAFSPSIEQQERRLAAIKAFTPADIGQILLSTNFGLQPAAAQGPKDGADRLHEESKPSGAGSPETKKDGGAALPDLRQASLANATLLRAGSSGFCQVARREKFKDVNAYLAEVRRLDPRFAHVIESAPAADQDRLSRLLSEYLCP